MRPATTALIFFLAGCLQAPAAAPDVLPSSSAVPTAQFESVKIAAGGDAETGVAVSPDGNVVLACSHGGFTQPSPLWASIDSGQTFRRIDPQPNPIVSGDCDLAITANGDWYIVYDTVASATVAASSDHGRTWRLHYFAAPPFGGVDRPWLQAVGDEVLLVYADVMAAEPFVAMFTKSADGGRTWSPPRPMGVFPDARQQPNCFLGHPIVHDHGRTIRAPINCWNGVTGGDAPFPNTIHLLTSRDAGATWTTQRVRGPDSTAHRIVIGAYAGDALVLVFTTGHPRVDVNVVMSRDEGATWSEPMVVAHQTSMRLGWPWIDARADGSATLAWMNVTQDDSPTWQVHAARIQTSTGLSLEFEGPVGEPAKGDALYEFLMVRHDAQGRAHIVYPVPGDACQSAPIVPSQGRNQQCVFLLRERSEARVDG